MGGSRLSRGPGPPPLSPPAGRSASPRARVGASIASSPSPSMVACGGAILSVSTSGKGFEYPPKGNPPSFPAPPSPASLACAAPPVMAAGSEVKSAHPSPSLAPPRAMGSGFSSWAQLFRAASSSSPSAASAEASALLERIQASSSDRVSIEEADLLSARLVWRSSLLGKFLGRAPPLFVLQNEIRAKWPCGDRVSVVEFAGGFFCFRFSGVPDDERLAILSASPWTLGGRLINLVPWKDNFLPLKERIHTAPVWLRLEGLPREYWSDRAIAKLVQSFGRLLKVDDFTSSLDLGKYARVCVELDLSMPLKSGVHVDHAGGSFYQTVSYENLPPFCVRCGFIGHSSARCSAPTVSSSVPGSSLLPGSPGEVMESRPSVGVSSVPHGEVPLLGRWLSVERRQPRRTPGSGSSSRPTPAAGAGRKPDPSVPVVNRPVPSAGPNRAAPGRWSDRSDKPPKAGVRPPHRSSPQLFPADGSPVGACVSVALEAGPSRDPVSSPLPRASSPRISSFPGANLAMDLDLGNSFGALVGLAEDAVAPELVSSSSFSSRIPPSQLLGSSPVEMAVEGPPLPLVSSVSSLGPGVSPSSVGASSRWKLRRPGGGSKAGKGGGDFLHCPLSSFKRKASSLSRPSPSLLLVGSDSSPLDPSLVASVSAKIEEAHSSADCPDPSSVRLDAGVTPLGVHSPPPLVLQPLLVEGDAEAQVSQ